MALGGGGLYVCGRAVAVAANYLRGQSALQLAAQWNSGQSAEQVALQAFRARPTIQQCTVRYPRLLQRRLTQPVFENAKVRIVSLSVDRATNEERQGQGGRVLL